MDAARGIMGVLNGRIDDVRFETEEAEAIITSAPSSPTQQKRPSTYAYGAIEGRVHALSSRNELKFTLYDALGRGIPCYLQKGDEEMMRDAREKWAAKVGYPIGEPDPASPTLLWLTIAPPLGAALFRYEDRSSVG